MTTTPLERVAESKGGERCVVNSFAREKEVLIEMVFVRDRSSAFTVVVSTDEGAGLRA